MTGRNLAREDMIATLHTQGRTMAQIGKAIGLTKERVRQILKRLGITGYQRCFRCGKVLQKDHRPETCAGPKPKVKRKHKAGWFICSKCGNTFVLTGPTLSTTRHNLTAHLTMRVWCPACRAERVYGPWEGACAACGVTIVRTGASGATARFRQKHGHRMYCPAHPLGRPRTPS